MSQKVKVIWVRAIYGDYLIHYVRCEEVSHPCVLSLVTGKRMAYCPCEQILYREE